MSRSTAFPALFAERITTNISMGIRKADGMIVEETHTPSPRTVVLDPDSYAYFSDSESVNRALRTLINIVPEKKST